MLIYLQSFIKLFKLFHQLFLVFLFLESCPAKTLPLAQQEWGTNEEGEKKTLLTSGPGYTHRTTERLSCAFQNTPFLPTAFSTIFQVRWLKRVSSKISKTKETTSIQQLKICHH